MSYTHTDDTFVQEALERYEASMGAEDELRQAMREDLDFLALNQWPESLKQMRENDSENGARPCLTMDKLNQYVRQVVNDARQNRPAIKVRAVEDGDSGVAQVFQGLTRNIEDVSRADIAYDRSLEGGAGVGRGWFRVNTEYVREDSSIQDIRILSIADPLAVVPDADYLEPDGSDMEYVFLPQDLKREAYDRMFPKAKSRASWQNVEGWYSSEHVRISEYYCKKYESKKLLRLVGGQEVFEGVLEELKAEQPDLQVEVHDEREVQVPRVKWYKMNCYEVLEETDWLGRWIPVIPVHGNELWVDGKRVLFGMVRPAKDPMRLYNYSRSAFAELVALAPKAPWVIAAGQIEGYEAEWKAANRQNKAYLPYNPQDVAGTPVPPPQRTQFAGVPQGLLQDMMQAEHDIQSSLGMYAPSIGQPSNERSGKAILARQREGDIGAFHYRDNLGRSIRHCGRILVDLIPKIYDTRRVVRIIGDDGVESQVIIDPRSQQASTQITTLTGEVRKIYNLDVGIYDVTVSSGPGYTTKREEAANAILQLTQAVPQLFGVVGDLLVKSMDWPYADEVARRLRMMLPPGLRPQEEGGQPPVPLEAQKKIMQLSQTLQAMTQQMQELEGERTKLKGVVDGKVIDRKIKQDEAQVRMAEIDLKWEELQVERAKIQNERLQLLDGCEAREMEGETRRMEHQVKLSEMGEEKMERDSVQKGLQEGFMAMAKVLQDMQQAVGVRLSPEGQATLDQIAPAKEPEVPAITEDSLRGVLTQVLAESEARIKQMIEESQTVGMIPKYDDNGNIVGGTAIQRNGDRRDVSLGRRVTGG